MSKASEIVARREELQRLENMNDRVTFGRVTVSLSGMNTRAVIDGGPEVILTASDSMALGRWLLEMFGEVDGPS